MSKADYKHSKSKTDPELKDLWQTPIEVYEYWNNKHHFVCDVAASEDNHLHPNYLDENYNSALNGWVFIKNGFVYCNPPFSNITPWIEQANLALKHGVGTVMLLPVDTSVGWFNLIRRTASEIHYVVNGRISFVHAKTKKRVNGNNKGSMFIVYDPEHVGDLDNYYLERDDILKKYNQIRESIPNSLLSAVWPEKVNRIFYSIESSINLKPEIQAKVKQSINKMIMDRLPAEQLNNAARILVDRMEAKL